MPTGRRDAPTVSNAADKTVNVMIVAHAAEVTDRRAMDQAGNIFELREIDQTAPGI